MQIPPGVEQQVGGNRSPLYRFLQTILASLGVPASRIVAAGNGLQGGGDLSADRSFAVQPANPSIVASPAGTSVGVIDDTMHGGRGGGLLHVAATPLAAGFMSSADKTKLDASPGRRAAAEVLFDPSLPSSETSFNTFVGAYNECIAAKGIVRLALPVGISSTVPPGLYDFSRIIVAFPDDASLTVMTFPAGTVVENPKQFEGRGRLRFTGGTFSYTRNVVTRFRDGVETATVGANPAPAIVPAGISVLLDAANKTMFGANFASVAVGGFLECSVFDAAEIDDAFVSGPVGSTLFYGADSSCPSSPLLAPFLGTKTFVRYDEGNGVGFPGGSSAPVYLTPPLYTQIAQDVDSAIQDTRGALDVRGFQAIPAGFANAAALRALPSTNFEGAVFTAETCIDPARIYAFVTAALGAQLAVSIYQAPDGRLNTLPLQRVASGTTPALAAGSVVVSLALTKNLGHPRGGYLVPGTYVVIWGRTNASALTVGVLSSGTVQVLTSVVPATKVPTQFTTVLPASAIPPTFDPTVHTPNGAVGPRLLLGS